jgi:hypothetical protein
VNFNSVFLSSDPCAYQELYPPIYCQALLILNSEYCIAKGLLPIGGIFSAIEEEGTVPALTPPHHEEQKESEKSDAASQAQDTNKDDEKKTKQSSQEHSFEDYRCGLIRINKSYRISRLKRLHK